MKKVLLHSLICIGLLTGSMASAIGPRRLWHCVTTPKDCTEQERKEARGWIIGVPVAVIVAALAAVGIVVGKGQVEKMKSEQQKTRDEITAEMIKLSEERKQATADDRARIDREISRLNALRATVGQ